MLVSIASEKVVVMLAPRRTPVLKGIGTLLKTVGAMVSPPPLLVVEMVAVIVEEDPEMFETATLLELPL